SRAFCITAEPLLRQLISWTRAECTSQSGGYSKLLRPGRGMPDRDRFDLDVVDRGSITVVGAPTLKFQGLAGAQADAADDPAGRRVRVELGGGQVIVGQPFVDGATGDQQAEARGAVVGVEVADLDVVAAG